MSLTLRILVGLVVGLVLGILLGGLAPSWLGSAIAIADTVGGLWLDALRMTIIPLVFSLIVVGVTAAVGAGAAGGLTGRTLLWFAGLLLAGAAFAAVATPALLALWPTPQIAAEGLRIGAASTPAPEVPPMSGAWLRSFVPVNPVQSAAESAIAPLTIFAFVFGLAAARLEAVARERLVGFFDAVAEAMLTLVKWVLVAAPLGVLALAFGVGAKAGIGAAGALLHYVLIVSAVGVGLTMLLYPLAIIGGRVPPWRFARGLAPAQVVAFSTQSSLASLPSMFVSARTIGVGERTAGVVLPLAVSLFRMSSPTMNLAVVVYIAHVMGVPLSPANLVVGVVVAALVSLAAVGLPGQVSFFTTIGPIAMAMGVPITLLPLLLAVETIPDIWRTIGNVTADVTVTALVSEGEEGVL